MIAVDTSSLSAYLEGSRGSDVELVERALADAQVVLPPVVLCELLSAPRLPAKVALAFRDLPLLEVHGGYWERAGGMRSRILARRLKARLADALIAQSCIDHRVPLITRDADYRHYVRAGGLKLLP